MRNMPIGMITLIVAAVLIYFGLAQRVLDRMRLSDRAALAFIALIVVGSYVDIRLFSEPVVSVNIGGAVIPLILAGYLYVKAGTTKERTRAIIAPLVVGAAIYALGRLMPAEPETMFIDPLYVYGIVAGVIAYLMGRSRRAAFIAGLVGVILSDIFHLVEITVRRMPGTVNIGGAGAFDAVIIAGILAVVLAELIGETRERLQGGPIPVEERSPELRGQNFSPNLEPSTDKNPAERGNQQPADEQEE
ncbi:MAG: DUF1614 domain-containing protein [bacterium]|jgi:uncharacterized membrane protein